MMRRFELHRDIDISGVSGTGVVCWGVEFPDGRAATRWAQSEHGRQTAAWDSIDHVIAVHGHHGATRLVWID